MKKRKGKVFKGSVLERLDELEVELAEARAIGDADWIQDTELEIEELMEKGAKEDT
jgi:hypothetical protein